MANSSNSTNSSNCSPPEEFIHDYLEFILVIITYGFTFIAGVIGNSLIIWSVHHYRHMKSLSNMFLANLALADLLLIIICIPIEIARIFSFTWEFGEFLCKLVPYLQNVTAICSVSTLTTISIKRYFIINEPIKSRTHSKKKTKLLLACVWAFSFIAAVPIIFLKVHDAIQCKRYHCKLNYGNKYINHYVIFMFILILVFPLLIICTINFLISRKLKKMFQDRKMLKGGDSSSIKEFKINDSLFLMPKLTVIKNFFNCKTLSKDQLTNEIGFSELANENLNFNHNIIENMTYTNRKLYFSTNSNKLIDKNLFSSFDSIKMNSLKKYEISFDNSENIGKTEITNINSENQSLHEIDNENMEINCNRPKNKLNTNLSQVSNTCYNEKNDDKTIKQVNKMLLVVVILFFITWAPILTFTLLRSFKVIGQFNTGFVRYIRNFFYLLSYLNSVVNPFIYGFLSKSFKNSFIKFYKNVFKLN